MGVSQGVAGAAAPQAPRCAGCGRALSTHWTRKHRAKMRGAPECNCCRASEVPVRTFKVSYFNGMEVHDPLEGEPMSGSVWSDPFLEGDDA